MNSTPFVPDTEALVILLQGGAPLPADIAAWDAARGGVAAAVLAAGDFRARQGEVLPVWLGATAPRRLLLAGLGAPGEVTLEDVRQAAGEAARAVQDLGHESVRLVLPAPATVGWAGPERPDWEALAEAATEGALMGIFRFERSKKAAEQPTAGLGRVEVSGPAPDQAAVERGVERARQVAACVNHARSWILRPGNDLTPARWADEVRVEAEALGLHVEVLDELDLERRGFAGIVTVGRGSECPPRLMTVWHRGGPADQAPVAIVGKGVTFDSGGIGIKPSKGMEKMKYDMAGGAAALATVYAAARLQLPLNVVAVVPAVENMPGAHAVVPNEIVKAYGGLMIEINDTDAEGRVILADAIAHAARDLKARAIVDIATLTGAIGIALGREVTGLMGTHGGLTAALLAAGDAAGEPGWELPLHARFDAQLKSDLADMLNYPGRDASAITAAAFMKPFTFDVPWTHFDIAGVGWCNSSKGHRVKGPSGAPIRTLVTWLRRGAPF